MRPSCSNSAVFKPLAIALCGLASVPAWAQNAPPAPTPAPAPASKADSGAEIVVTARRLNDARESIKPSLGASTYTLTTQAIQYLPGSDNQPIEDIILQLPGVSQDQFGQFHVRSEHNGVQYRLNGVILPESIAVFGQTLSPRLIERMDLVTGTLPAQYGLRTAGIIDITTKSGLKDSSTFSLYGGSHDTIEPSAQLSGSTGGGSTTWFASGDYKHSDLGIDNVTGATHAIHDKTDQFSSFGYIDHILGGNDRIAFTGGYSNQHYQIPNPPGQVGSQTSVDPATGLATVPIAVNGVTQYPSEQLNEQQLQTFGFGALSLLHNAGAFTFQGSIFGRIATLDYHPDTVGELLFNAQAQAASKKDVAFGGQFDSVFKLSNHHTVRAGLYVEDARSKSHTDTAVFQTCNPAGNTCPAGAIIPDAQPESLIYATNITQRTYSAYLQDEWHLTSQVVFNYGARFDENDGVRHERQLSPRVNMVWTPSHQLTLHAGYARYFSPAPFELVASANLAQLAHTTAAPASATGDLAYAQRENYWDAGLQQKLGHLTVGLDGYFRRSTHLVDEGQFGAPIIETPFNYAKGRIMGGELSLNYATHRFSAYANIAYEKAQGTQIDSNQYSFAAADLAYIATHYIYLDHNQSWTGSGGAAYHWDSGALANSRISADMVYGSGLRRDLDLPPGLAYATIPNGAALPSYVTFNLSVGHQFGKSGFDVRVDVENLLDKVYEIRDGTGVGVGAPSFGPRRGVFLGISKTI